MYLFADFASNPNPIFAVDVDDLIERDDFTNVSSLDNGRLAPYVEVEIDDNGTDKTFLQFVNDANPGLNTGRIDIRWGVGPDGEMYVLNKRDGVVRKIVGVTGPDRRGCQPGWHRRCRRFYIMAGGVRHLRRLEQR